MRSPAGALLCPNIPGPDCATSPSGAACSNQPPPEGYGPPQPFTICPASGCVPITVAPPQDDDDEECDPEVDPECEEPPPPPPDCPAGDPDCEEDDECPEGFEGTPPFCEKDDENGICTEEDQTVCDILREIREAAQGTEANTALQLKEDLESNAKLAAIKNQAMFDAERALAATNRVQVATDSVRTAVNNAASTVSSSVSASSASAASTVSSAVSNSTTAQTAALSAKLDGLKTAIDGASQCGGVGEPSCSTGGGSGELDGITSDTGSLDTTGDYDSGATAAQVIVEEDDGDFVFDDGGFLGGSRDCPTFDPPSLPWGQVSLPFQTICSAFSILATMIVLGAYAQAAYIIGGKR